MKFKPECQKCFAGLSCGVRMEIVNLLKKEKKMSVMNIAGKFKKTQPTITHHLTYLKEMGILRSKKEGRNIYYYLNPKCVTGDCNIFS